MLKKKLLIGLAAMGLCSVAFANGDAYTPPPAFQPSIDLGVYGGYGMTHWNYYDKFSKKDGFAAGASLAYHFMKPFSIGFDGVYMFNKPNMKGSGKVKSIYALDIFAKIQAPVMDNFGFYGIIGPDYLHRNAKGIGLKSKGVFNVVYGAGAYYKFYQNFYADLGWKRYGGYGKQGSSKYTPDLDVFTLGVHYEFPLSGLGSL